MKIVTLVLTAAVVVTACANRHPFQSAVPAQPEGSSGYAEKSGWAATRFAVAAANPLATKAGYQVLKAGGSAVDAAIAVQMVLALVEPQSSGIGGGAFLLHFDGRNVEAFDGRETAPAAATETLFIGADGQPLPFMQAVLGGHSVGTPGTLRILELAHRQHGKLPWASLFEPAIALAENGFAVSARMHTLLASEQHLKKDATAGALFYDAGGAAWPVGHLLKNPELGAVLRLIARDGANALMQGDIAQAIVIKVRQHAERPGRLSLSDLAQYEAKKRSPLCFDYLARTPWREAANDKEYRICGMPPPSSGTIAIGQILGILNNTPAATLVPVVNADALTPSADWLHLYTEASRLAFADRAQYVADPDFVAAPAGDWTSLLASDYLHSRSQLIAIGAGTPRMTNAPPGNPDSRKTSFAPMAEQPEYGTSHISIVDAWGNALAMTSTIEDAWGARLMVNRGLGLSGGFLLNNELTDFSLAPTDAAGKPVANRVQGGKRPRSSMSPILVFDKASGQLVLSTGSPGGALIIHYTAKTLYAMLNWDLNAQQAINVPNFGSAGGPLLLEDKRFPMATIATLQSRGHEVVQTSLTSGVQAIARSGSGLFGGADPRREGVVMGD